MWAAIFPVMGDHENHQNHQNLVSINHQKKRSKSLKTWNCVQIKGASPIHEFCSKPLFEHSFTFWAVFWEAKVSRYRSCTPPRVHFEPQKSPKIDPNFYTFLKRSPECFLRAHASILSAFWPHFSCFLRASGPQKNSPNCETVFINRVWTPPG